MQKSKKMVNSISQQENANQNLNGIVTHLIHFKRLTILNISEDVNQMRFPYIAGMSIKIITSEKVSDPVKVKLIIYHTTPKFYYYVFTLEEEKQIVMGKLV